MGDCWGGGEGGGERRFWRGDVVLCRGSGLLVEIEDYAQGLVGDCCGGGEEGGEGGVLV